MSNERIVIVRHLSAHEAEVLEFWIDNYPCPTCKKGDFEHACIRVLDNSDHQLENQFGELVTVIS
jgi:hypothetical protein